MLPIYYPLNYTRDAIKHQFNSLSHLPWAMLLHSGCAQDINKRFDILVADPKVTLITRGQRTDIVSLEKKCTYVYHNKDPLKILQQELTRCNLKPEYSIDFPFQGGALGLFGYDLIRSFEHIPSNAQQQLKTPDMAIGIYDWVLIADHYQKKLTLIVHGNVSARLAWLSNHRAPRHKPFHLISKWQANMSRDEYFNKFCKVQDFLLAGDCYQINLSQRFDARYEGDEWQAFCYLCKINSAPFSAFIRLSHSVILSFSPERFVKLNQQSIETRPIKGTLPRLYNAVADYKQAKKLFLSEKDRSENVMIVDLLRNDIGRVAKPGTIKVPELFFVETFPAVHHLVSKITAELKPSLTAFDLLRACFPGGSITGAPKLRAIEIIEQLEPQRRNAWCGSIGYISFCGSMDTNIAIRTLIAENKIIYCSAGGGVVSESEASKEYQETLDKLNLILPLLAKFNHHCK